MLYAPINFIASIPILGSLSGFKHFTPFGDWYFGEFAFVFLLGSILIGLINRMPEEQFVKEFANGAKDLLGVILVLSVANGYLYLWEVKVKECL